MRLQVYPKGISLRIDEEDIYAIETSMSGVTMIAHAPGVQIPILNGVEVIESDTFSRNFVEMSPGRWIRPTKISSVQRFGDEYVRIMLDGVRQAFDLFPGRGARAGLPRAEAEDPRRSPYLALEVAA